LVVLVSWLVAEKGAMWKPTVELACTAGIKGEG